MHKACKLQQRCGSIFGCFDNYCATGSQRWRQLYRREEHLRVPRHDRRNHTYGFTFGKCLHLWLIQWNCGAMNFVRDACKVAIVFCDVSNLGAGFSPDFPRIPSLNLRQNLYICRQKLSQLVK